MNERQICFPVDNDYIVCNGIYRKGRFVKANTKWFKFRYKKRKTT